ncbi:MFS transporter [Aquamicrobium segne]|uniref:MFS transporter n=1 Tax=Aquamicrobium segne TaxID=469547 RepID=A0ABW0GXP3_9HYPH
MALHVRHPIWLRQVRPAGARTFASLYTMESFARAMVASVIPIQAYEILQSEQAVSVLYTLVSLLGLSATLFMPVLIRRFARRWVYTAGALFLALGSLFFIVDTLAGQALGMLFRVVGSSALSITLNLYIMDHIRKTEFIRTESLRMAWSTFAWTGGPTLGILLYTHYGIYAAHGAVAVLVFILLAMFWYYRLSDNEMIVAGKNRALNPVSSIGRFIAQPRLRLAWLIAFGRSCYWTTFFVYGPLFMVIAGEGELAGGLLVSAGNILLFTAIFWGKAGKRYGARQVIGFAFAAMGLILFAAGWVSTTAPLITGAFLLCGAFFTIALDTLGSIVFMRSVRSYERSQMAAVYRTYLDFAELAPPLVYSIILVFFGVGSVFVTLGLLMVVCAVVSWRYVPRSM